jgi:hypothetical protein
VPRGVARPGRKVCFYLTALAEEGLRYDTVRCAFVEGRPAFPGSGIRSESHIQIAVRNPACVVGGFQAHNGEVMSQKAKNKRPVKKAIADAGTQVHRKVLAKMGKMSPRELFDLAVRAGIYTENGKLTRPYRDDAGPSASRPTD